MTTAKAVRAKRGVGSVRALSVVRVAVAVRVLRIAGARRWL